MIATAPRFNPAQLTQPAPEPAALTGVPEAPTPPPPAPTGLKKVSFGKAAPRKGDSKTAYPVFPDPNGQAAIIAARIQERLDQFEALESALKTDKAELSLMTAPFYFQTNHGRAEIPSSVSVHSPRGEVLVTFQNRYPALSHEAAVVGVLGDRTGEFFEQTFDLKISSDKLPQDAAQDFINALFALCDQFHCPDALVVKEGVKPTKTFHEARHRELTVEQNLTLQQVCPIVAMIKTKGRKCK